MIGWLSLNDCRIHFWRDKFFNLIIYVCSPCLWLSHRKWQLEAGPGAQTHRNWLSNHTFATNFLTPAGPPLSARRRRSSASHPPLLLQPQHLSQTNEGERLNRAHIIIFHLVLFVEKILRTRNFSLLAEGSPPLGLESREFGVRVRQTINTDHPGRRRPSFKAPQERQQKPRKQAHDLLSTRRHPEQTALKTVVSPVYPPLS